jgi:hypothetical protein
MNRADSNPEKLIADWESSLRSAYAFAEELADNDDEATRLLMSALDDAFMESPHSAPSCSELTRRISTHAGSSMAA